jgi:hypothetical protein
MCALRVATLLLPLRDDGLLFVLFAAGQADATGTTYVSSDLHAAASEPNMCMEHWRLWVVVFLVAVFDAWAVFLVSAEHFRLLLRGPVRVDAAPFCWPSL